MGVMIGAAEVARLLKCSRQWVYVLHERRDCNGFPEASGDPKAWPRADVITWKMGYVPSLGGAPTSKNRV